MRAMSADAESLGSMRNRGRPKREKIQSLPLIGRKYIRQVEDYLRQLRAHYAHPNRQLFYDDVVTVYLLAFFNPVIRSLRCIQDVSQVKGIHRFLSVEAVCRSTLSDANALFDPQHLQGLLSHVRDKLPALGHQDGALERLLHKVVCLDGSFFHLAGDVQWAMWHRNSNADTRRHLRLNCVYCQKEGVPLGVSISGDDGQGEGAAAVKLLDALAQEGVVGTDETERIYLFDSGVVSFELICSILKRREHLLCNLRDEVGFTVERELPLSERDRKAGVISDRVGRLSGSIKHPPPEGTLREIIIPYVDRKGKSRHVRLLTNLLDVPAWIIAELYRYRWQIELFFRWLKIHVQFRHLLSHSRNGVTTSFYIAVLAAMLLCLQTRQPLSKYSYNLCCAVASGLATPQEILPILQRRMRESDLAKQRLARKRTEKTNG